MNSLLKYFLLVCSVLFITLTSYGTQSTFAGSTIIKNNQNIEDSNSTKYFDQACDTPFSDGTQQSCELMNCVVAHFHNFKHDNQLRSFLYGQVAVSQFDFYHSLQLESNSLKSLQGYYLYDIYKLLI